MQRNGDKNLTEFGNDNNMQNPASMSKSIMISGFKNIKDGDLPVLNEYGIETGMSIHPNRDMIYELSIPLTRLEVNLDMKQPLVYNIKINQPAKPDFKKGSRPEGSGRAGGKGGMGMGGGRGGMRGGRQRPQGGSSDRIESKNADFWIKYKLAKS
ncbi:hypothetical protein [Pedobacter jamesrossensis]|uniref:Uncharacterized protein n=1 Tax=Pedobacter jamesrossensis TaxID=1908238 RepID=A0ABV8NE70_9SPHI